MRLSRVGFVLTSLSLLAVPLACEKDKPVSEAKPAAVPSPVETAAVAPPVVSAAPPPPAATVLVSETATAPQLVEGFYGVEDGSWRWTSKHFAVDLGVPPEAKKNGAALHFSLTVPEVALKANPALALSASIGETLILAAKYKKAGAYEFVGDVPATALQADHVRVDFTLDKSFSPGGADTRDLGVISHSIALAAK
jgi:hypothetical protein